jgi:hypothetical protein
MPLQAVFRERPPDSVRRRGTGSATDPRSLWLGVLSLVVARYLRHVLGGKIGIGQATVMEPGAWIERHTGKGFTRRRHPIR